MAAKLVASLLCVFTFASGQKLECHVQGFCYSGTPLKYSFEPTYLDCHQACRDFGPECTWFTFYGDKPVFDINCELHSQCDFASTPEENYYSGQTQCPLVGEATCHAKGECVRTSPIEVTKEETYNDCLLECQSSEDGGCEWFTYHSLTRDCLQYFVCPQVDVMSCTHCYSGQAQCEKVPETTECQVRGEYVLDFPFGFSEVSGYDACLKSCQTFEGLECKCFTMYGNGGSEPYLTIALVLTASVAVWSAIN